MKGTSKISSIAGLTEISVSLIPSGFVHAIVESPASIRLIDLQQEPLHQFRSWDRCLAFGPESELRWIKRTSGFHLVLISDQDASLPGSTNATPLTRVASDRLFLRGKRQPGEDQFLEGRIPASLPYPSGLIGETLEMQINLYQMAVADGVRSLFRCVRIAERSSA